VFYWLLVLSSNRTLVRRLECAGDMVSKFQISFAGIEIGSFGDLFCKDNSLMI